MSAPDERTPLIRNVHHDDPAQQRDQQSSTDIKAQSRSILLSLQNEDVVILDIGAGPVDFLVLLYATRCLCDFLHEGFTSGNDSISSSVARERQESNIRHRIDQEVIKILDVWGHGAVDDVSLYEALWTRWDIDERGVSALDLMVLQENGSSQSRCLSHPLIAHFVRHLYSHGPILNRQPGLKGAIGAIEGSITPRRAHILHFVSYLALWLITIIFAMQSPNWATHTSPRPAHSSAIEILWMVLASAAVVQVFQHSRNVSKNLFLVPTALALFTLWTTSGFTFLAISIPCLTLSPLRADPPSMPFLFPSLLPHSVRLWDVVTAGFTGWALIWPIVIILCVVCSISLNGDIFRGFLVTIPSISISGSDPPVEEGVAPYETRVAIFGTILILVYLAICLSISNITKRSARRSRHPANQESEACTQARVEMISGMRWILGDLGQDHFQLEDRESNQSKPPGLAGYSPPPVPLPFNLILLPLDLFVVILNIIRRLRSRKDRGTFGWTIYRIRYFVSILLVGIPCRLMSLVV